MTKKVPLVVDAVNPDDNFNRTWTAPHEITIKGSQDAVEKIQQISTQEIDLTYVYDSIEMDLEYELPDGIFLANDSLGKTIKVRVTEKKTEETEDSDDSN